MRRKILGGLVVVVALAGCVSGASAHRFSLSPEAGFRVQWQTWMPSIGWEGGQVIVSCPATLEGSFHSRTLVKTAGALIGYITRAVTNEAACSSSGAAEARLRFLAETLPWHLVYNGFEGSLPNIAAVRFNVVGQAIRVSGLSFGSSCLYLSTTTRPMFDGFDLNATTRAVRNYRTAGEIPLREGSPFCSETMFMSGNTTNVTVRGGTSSITVTLI